MPICSVVPTFVKNTNKREVTFSAVSLDPAIDLGRRSESTAWNTWACVELLGLSLQSGRVAYFNYGDDLWYARVVAGCIKNDEYVLVTPDWDFDYDVVSITNRNAASSPKTGGCLQAWMSETRTGLESATRVTQLSLKERVVLN